MRFRLSKLGYLGLGHYWRFFLPVGESCGLVPVGIDAGERLPVVVVDHGQTVMVPATAIVAKSTDNLFTSHCEPCFRKLVHDAIRERLLSVEVLLSDEI
jgi:hypothetical protein